MIQKFKLILPEQLDLTTKLLKKFVAPSGKGEELFLFEKMNHVIIQSQRRRFPLLPLKISRISRQIEIPVSAMPWVAKTVENTLFYKDSSEGSVEGQSSLFSASFNGESLEIRYDETDGIAGLLLTNLSRKDHKEPSLPQKLFLSETFLRKQEVVAFLKFLLSF